LEWSEREAVRKTIDTPQAVLLVCLRTNNNAINSEGDGAELAMANVYVTWSQLKYPFLFLVACSRLTDCSTRF